MISRLGSYSSVIFWAVAAGAVREAARTHWFDAAITLGMGLMLALAVQQAQRAWYFYQHPDELAAWRAAPPPPPGFRGGRRLRLWRWATWPPEAEGAGFEPARALPPNTLSRRAP